MVNKKIGLGMLVMVLVFGMTVIGCDNGSNEEPDPDTWSELTSFSQLIGRWQSSSYTNESITPREYVESNGGTWDVTTAQSYGDMRISMNSIIYSGIAFFDDRNHFDELDYLGSYSVGGGSLEVTYVFSGGNINTMWTWIKSSHPGATFNDSTHSITEQWAAADGRVQDIDEQLMDDIMENTQINQNGTKIKSTTFGSSSSIIYIKQ